MSKFFHSVFLEEDKCRGCVTCLHHCPTQAIRIGGGKAYIMPEYCIDCGECVRNCPHQAKETHRDKIEVLQNYKYTIALPAPSLFSQFNHLTDINIVLHALLRLGFDDVCEVGAAAELVSAESKKYIQYHKDKWPLISTACPTIERLIRVRFPNLLEHLLPILPPTEVAAIMARRKAVRATGLKPEEIGVIFISPCPSKVSFIKEPLGIIKSNIDAALAMKDLYPMLLSEMKKMEEHPENLHNCGKIGIGWGVTGGEVMGLASDFYVAVDGIDNIIQVLEDLEDEKFPENLQFIELNACPAGCVGGVMNIENPFIAKAKQLQLIANTDMIDRKADNSTNVYSAELYFTKKIHYEPVFQLGHNMLESMANLSAVEKLLEELPGLDCGSCGAPSCRKFAEDCIKNPEMAKKNFCIYLHHRDALKNSPLFKEETLDYDD